CSALRYEVGCSRSTLRSARFSARVIRAPSLPGGTASPSARYPGLWSAALRDNAVAAGTHPEPAGGLLQQPHGAVSPLADHRQPAVLSSHFPEPVGVSELLRADRPFGGIE